MPRPSKYDWNNIRLDLEAGQTNEYVHKKYDVPYDALNKHLKRNPLRVSQEAKDVISGFDEVSQQVIQLADKQPELAERAIDIVKEKHPEFKQAMIHLSSKLFNRMMALSDEANASEVVSLSKGMQTVTDTLGITQRHASNQTQVNVQNNNANIQKIERVIVDAK